MFHTEFSIPCFQTAHFFHETKLYLYNNKLYLYYVTTYSILQGSATAESKGVDLHVLERTINSTHVDLEYFFEAIMEGYKQFSPKQFVPVEKKLKEIERRGRKREMVG